MPWERLRENWRKGSLAVSVFQFAGQDGNGNTLAARDPFANFLFRRSHGVLSVSLCGFQHPQTKASYAFAQDEWHVASNLTLTYGLRYEYSTPKSDTQGRTYSVIPGSAQSTVFPGAPLGLLFPGDKGALYGSELP